MAIVLRGSNTSTFSSSVSVGGTITYDDVKEIDSVGIITARSGIKVSTGGVHITSGGLNVVGGGITFADNVVIGTTSALGKLHARPADECNFIVREEATSLVLSAETNAGRDNNRLMTLEGAGFVFNSGGNERVRITSTGLVDISGGIQVSENTTPSSGAGLELFREGNGGGQIQAFDRDNSTSLPLILKGSQIQIFASGSESLSYKF